MIPLSPDLTLTVLQAGETIVISSGAGQMGHILGQIAKYVIVSVPGACPFPTFSALGSLKASVDIFGQQKQ